MCSMSSYLVKYVLFRFALFHLHSLTDNLPFLFSLIVSVFCNETEALSAISNSTDGFHVAIVEVIYTGSTNLIELKTFNALKIFNQNVFRKTVLPLKLVKHIIFAQNIRLILHIIFSSSCTAQLLFYVHFPLRHRGVCVPGTSV